MSDINVIRSKVPEDELLILLAEEATELAHAALKLHRAITGKNPTPVSVDDAKQALLEEIADVELCQWALRLSSESMVTISHIMSRKTRRWISRLEGQANDN